MTSKITFLPPMYRFAPHCMILAFAVWSAFALRGDLAQLSFIPIIKSWDLVLLAVLLSLANYSVRIFRWRFYFARFGYSLPIGFAVLTYTAGFAYTLSPGKVGELVRGQYYRPLGIPLTVAAAAFFCERLMDLVAMVVLAALLFAGVSHYRGMIGGAVAMVAAVLATLTLVPWIAVAEALRSRARIPAWMRATLLAATASLAATRPLLRPGTLGVGFAIGLIAWGWEGVGLGVLTSVLPGKPLDASSAMGIYAVAVLIGGLSFLPGGLGSTEAVMTTLLFDHGYTVPQALLITLVCRLVTLWLAVALGWVAVCILRLTKPPAEIPC